MAPHDCTTSEGLSAIQYDEERVEFFLLIKLLYYVRTSSQICRNKAIKGVFGEHSYNLNISSKTMTGHLLGAAGAIEAIACVMAVEDVVHQQLIITGGPDLVKTSF